MQFEIKTTPKVKQLRVEFFIPFTKKTFRTIWQFYRTPDTWSVGQTSRCQDGRHVLFFDYDHIGLKEIEDELKYLQETFLLSHAYIFENDQDKSYHAVILDKFSLKEAHSILKESNVEWAYLESVRFTRGREWVLRIDKKGKRKAPIFLKVLKSKFVEREISKAHKLFLQKWFKAPKFKYFKQDKSTVIPLVNYNTGNRVD